MNDIGLDTLRARAEHLARAVLEGAVLGGISMGGGMVAHIWPSRPTAAGVHFLAGPGDWPTRGVAGTPVQMHAARPDPFDEEQVFSEWEFENPGTLLECFRYDGVGHYFLDHALADFGVEADALCRKRCLEFLARL